ncbi:MAG: T9SS type A sorting domain-containing protein [Bacteroidetes bacterium]|nr:T9SS type A sorting domain-containing protein [Bacteroidota bacterium]
MKITLGLAIGFFAATSLHAQSANVFKQRHDQLLNQLTRSQSYTAGPGAKTTGAMERLKSMSTYRVFASRASLIDSGVFMYSGSNGSTYNFTSMAYDYYYLPNNETDPPLFLHTKAPNNIPDIQYDSLKYFSASAGSLIPQYVSKRYYSSNLVTKTSQAFNDTTSTDHILSYNADGNVVTDVEISRYGAAYDTNFISYYIYNSSGQLIMDSILQAFGPSGLVSNFKVQYNHDAAGNITEARYYDRDHLGTWYYEERITARYTPDDRLQSMLTDTGASFVHMYFDSVGYTSGVDYYTYNTDSTWDGIGWAFYGASIKYINASSLPDSVVMIYRDASNPGNMAKEKHMYTYTAKGNPLTDIDSFSNPTSTHAISINNYYYEPYTLAVHEVTQNNYTLSLYPNPANDILYIKVNGLQSGRIIMNLYNEVGQIFKKAYLQNINGQSQINITDLSPGIYYVSILDDNGSAIRTQAIVKK